MADAVLTQEDLLLPIGRKADPELGEAIRSRDAKAVQRVLVTHWRKPRRRLEKALPAKNYVCLWSVDDIDLNGRERELASAIEHFPALRRGGRGMSSQRELSDAVEATLTAWQDDGNGHYGPWELMAVAELLLRHGKRISSSRFVAAFKVVADQAGTLTNQVVDAALPVRGSDPRLVRHLFVEAGLLVTAMLAPLDRRRRAQIDLIGQNNELLDAAMDAKGVISASWMMRLPALFATVVRTRLWADAFDIPLLSRTRRDRWTRCLRKALALCTADGRLQSQPVDCASPVERTLQVLTVAADLAGLPGDGRLARQLSTARRLQKTKRQPPRPASVMLRQPPKKRDIPSWQSDASQVAILRNSAEPYADSSVVWWQAGDVNVTLTAAGIPLLNGAWTWTGEINGVSVPAPQNWRSTCWYRDKDIALLELSGDEDADVVISRHVALSMTHQFAILTDTLCRTAADPDCEVRLETSLRTVPQMRSDTDAISPELLLTAHPRRRTRAIPAWLEDDRLRHSSGSFQGDSERLTLTCVGRGGVMMPLLFDWNDKRGNAFADWNRLTVCENGRIVSGAEAMACRIRAGALQVMLYRSLRAPSAARTVLGMHTAEESVYAKVESGAIPQSLVAIEGELART